MTVINCPCRPPSSFRNFHPARARRRMSATNAIARDENIRNLRRQAVGSSRRSTDPLAREIPDIFIPPTQHGNAGVISGRNENSGMTTGGRDSCRPLSFPSSAWECVTAKLCFASLINPPDSGFASPDWIRQAELGNDRDESAPVGD